ncbi:hypothetical protein PS2_0023 [Aeromonas phage PS2]|nr:hypothetical protein PS2_0023 [Aeromonas phage PS2]
MFKNVNEIVQYKEQIKQVIHDITSPKAESKEVDINIKEIQEVLRISFIDLRGDHKVVKFDLIKNIFDSGEQQLASIKNISTFTELDFFANGEVMKESVDACYELFFITFVTRLVSNSVYVVHDVFKGNLLLDFLKSGQLKGLDIKNTTRTVKYTVFDKHENVVWETSMSNRTGCKHFNLDSGYFNGVLISAMTMALIYNEDNWDVNISS